MRKLIDEIIKNEGATLKADMTSAELNSGFMVSLYGYEVKKELKDYKGIEKTLKEYSKYIEDKKDYYVGCWVDNNILYIDISEKIDNKKRALKVADKRQQLAIFNNQTKECIFLKYKKYVDVIEYHQVEKGVDYDLNDEQYIIYDTMEIMKVFNNNSEVAKHYKITDDTLKSNKKRNKKIQNNEEVQELEKEYNYNNLLEYSYIKINELLKIAIFENKELIL